MMEDGIGIKDAVRRIAAAAGACACGFAAAGRVGDASLSLYDSWLAGGRNAGMDYLGKYAGVRADSRQLLDGAATVISCAFDYRPAVRHPLFADYALGRDYHDVVRERLNAAAEQIRALYGGTVRVCVDTAPVRERYWAAVAGIGIIGDNGLLYVDGVGSKVFLAEMLWTVAVPPDASRLGERCPGCGACRKACPGGALAAGGSLDARRCRSYLTIEHRGELPGGVELPGRVYGCDVCQDVCPLNAAGGCTGIDEFRPSPELLRLDAEALKALDGDGFRALFGRSAVRRARLAGLLRNIARH